MPQVPVLSLQNREGQGALGSVVKSPKTLTLPLRSREGQGA
jgi:hypothetical protein